MEEIPAEGIRLSGGAVAERLAAGGCAGARAHRVIVFMAEGLDRR
jgi:hypothetical protein